MRGCCPMGERGDALVRSDEEYHRIVLRSSPPRGNLKRIKIAQAKNLVD